MVILYIDYVVLSGVSYTEFLSNHGVSMWYSQENDLRTCMNIVKNETHEPMEPLLLPILALHLVFREHQIHSKMYYLVLRASSPELLNLRKPNWSSNL